jgi:hypothetical protein
VEEAEEEEEEGPLEGAFERDGELQGFIREEAAKMWEALECK